MKRFRIAAIVLAIGMCLTSNASAVTYGWSVSKSPTDPLVNTGAPSGGIEMLYLWFWCSDQGWAAAEMNLETNPPNQILAFIMNGVVLNAGSATHLLLAVGGCPSAPLMAGSILVVHGEPMSICISNPVTVDCSADPQAWPSVQHGYADAGFAPCPNDATPCGPVSVESQSWGSIKSLYR